MHRRCSFLTAAHLQKIIGFEKDLGSIAPGKLADLLVLDQNPLENIHHTTSIRYVMKNGLLYNADTLDQIWPVEKKPGNQCWWNQEPSPRPPVWMTGLLDRWSVGVLELSYSSTQQSIAPKLQYGLC